MDKSTRLKLIELNKKLMTIEQYIKTERIRIIKFLTKFQDEGPMIYVSLDCYESNDKLLTTIEEGIHYNQKESLYKQKQYNYFLIADGFNHNDCGLLDLKDPSKLEFHCYLFHLLKSHSSLTPNFKQLTKIKDIMVNFKIEYQKEFIGEKL